MNNYPVQYVQYAPVQYVPASTYYAQWFTELLAALPIIIAMISILIKAFTELREVWSKKEGVR